MSQSREENRTRVAISSPSVGDVIPGNREELLLRDVYLEPGAHVEHGAVWANDLLVRGPGVTVDRAVYARDSILIAARDENAAHGSVTFGSVVSTRGSLRVDDAVRFRVRFDADVYANSVRLQNAIVFGHVFARSAVIENSVVLGGVYCRKSATDAGDTKMRGDLTLDRCIVATFDVESVSLGRDVSLFLPAAFAREEISVTEPVRVLSFYQLALGEEDSAAEAEGGALLLDASDVQREAAPDGSDDKPRYALSLGPRILDGGPLLKLLASNLEALAVVGATDHMETRERIRYRGENAFWLEDRLMGLVERRDLPTVEGYSRFIDLLDRAEIAEGLRHLGVHDAEQVLQRLRASSDAE